MLCGSALTPSLGCYMERSIRRLAPPRNICWAIRGVASLAGNMLGGFVQPMAEFLLVIEGRCIPILLVG